MRKLILSLAVALATLPGAADPVSAQAKNEIVWGDLLPAGLDTHVNFDVPTQLILLNLYDGLYRYVGNPPDLKPWLAEGHTMSPDGLTWTFRLRAGIKFHDGSAMTAEDVAYSFKRLLALGKGAAGTFKPILKPENVTTADERTVKFVLDRPYAPFLAALPLVAIVNKALVQKNEKDGDWGTAWLASNSAGSGAYSMDPATYRPQERLTFIRFKDHFFGWDDNKKPIDTVRAQPVQETSTRVLALLRGDIHATDSYLPADQVERVSRAKGVRVARDESMRTMLIRMNNSKPPFNNINFRKCVSHAMNYQGFISGIMKDFAIRNPGPNPRNLWGSPADLAGYSYDMKLAKDFCDKAKAEGAPISREIEIHAQAQLEQTNQLGQLLQSDLRKLGVNAKVVQTNFFNILPMTAKAETSPDMWIHWISTYFVDPENWIGQTYDSDFWGTFKGSSWYKNPKIDEMLRAARAESDQEKRRKIYEDASRIVVDEAVDVWIYNTIQLRGLSDRIEGYKFSPVGSGGDFRYLSLKD
jgi:peptide/nickel transport system substrate-binding protein